MVIKYLWEHYTCTTGATITEDTPKIRELTRIPEWVLVIQAVLVCTIVCLWWAILRKDEEIDKLKKSK